jgi:hypothetical protein
VRPLLHPGGVALSFPVSICLLTGVQALIVVLPAAREIPRLRRFASGWWALVPVGSVVGFVYGENALSGLAEGLTYLALIAVPPLAALALAWALRRGRPSAALAVVPLFALAWADRHGLAGEAAGVVLEALSAVTLGVLLVAVTPRILAKLGIIAMAVADSWLVLSHLLTDPNRTLNAVVPVAHLPQLQRAVLGAAVMGYGDLFVAGLLGALLAGTPRLAARGALIAAAIGLSMNLLFLVVNELPATVPVALTLVILEAHAFRARRRVRV